MSDLGDLTQSPLDEEGGRRPWAWAVGVVVLLGAIVAVIVIWRAGGEDTTLPSSTTVASSSTTQPDQTSDPGSLSVSLGPEPQFDTSGLGADRNFDPDAASPLSLAWQDQVSAWLAIGSESVVGRFADLPLSLVGAFGVVLDPYESSFGGPGTCYGLVDVQGDVSLSCFVVNSDSVGQALFVGLVGSGVTAWGALPNEASVGVLVVNGTDTAWQRVSGRAAAFEFEASTGDVVELRVVSASGETLGVVDRSRYEPSGATFVEARTGWGDFSTTPYDEIDMYEVDSLVVACMNDNGIPATLPSGETYRERSIDLSDVEEPDLDQADLVHAQCRVGLKLPLAPIGPSPDQLEARYVANVKMHECLSDLGYDTGPAPSFPTWMEQPDEARWDPFLILLSDYPDDFESATKSCTG